MSMFPGRTEPAEPAGTADERAADQAPPTPVEVPIPSRLVALARVNLMPNSYARRAAVRRAKVAAVAALVCALLVAALLFLVSWQKATSAQERLDQATFERTSSRPRSPGTPASRASSRPSTAPGPTGGGDGQ